MNIFFKIDELIKKKKYNIERQQLMCTKNTPLIRIYEKL